MGALHEGHLALCREARKENQKFVASVFVNPTQFAPDEDYQKYFRPFEHDCKLLEKLGCDAVFAPAPEQMYRGANTTQVIENELTTLWEGKSRPTHFAGVTTIVTKLFHLIPAHRAYFGEKDYQQLKVIQRMVENLNFPIKIMPVPTVREEDGLAKSSRNAYLNSQERQAAKVLFLALSAAAKAANEGEKKAAPLIDLMKQICQNEPLFHLDYAVVVDAQTLRPIDLLQKEARALIAGHIGDTHLIDNYPIIL